MRPLGNPATHEPRRNECLSEAPMDRMPAEVLMLESLQTRPCEAQCVTLRRPPFFAGCRGVHRVDIKPRGGLRLNRPARLVARPETLKFALLRRRAGED
jgi:hypothetical protein